MFEWHEFTGLESQLPTDRDRMVFVRFANGNYSEHAHSVDAWSWGIGQVERRGFAIVGWRYHEDEVEKVKRLEAENV